MKLDNFWKFSSYAWKEIFIGFVSTVLGIAVTIGVDKKLEDNQAEQDKRNLTIMIIHDLDESEQLMRGYLDFYRSFLDKAEYVSQHLDQIDEIPGDTLSSALAFLSIDMESNRLKFAQMAENILTTNMSNWTTLNNVKFMSNAERCYAYRKMFNEMTVDPDVRDSVKKLHMAYYAKLLKQDMDLDKIRKIVFEVYGKEEVSSYVHYFKLILDKRSSYVAYLHQLNSENKWLMSVSSEDIEEYVKASSKRAPAERPRVTKESIVGTWQYDIDFLKGVRKNFKSLTITFNSDNTYKIVKMADAYETSVDTAYTHTETAYGHWKLEGNNLIRTFDSIKIVPTAKYADEKEFIEYLAEHKANVEKNSASSHTVMSDILISDSAMSTMEYTEGEEDQPGLAHYRRK